MLTKYIRIKMTDMADHLSVVLRRDNLLIFQQNSLEMIIVYIISYNKLSRKLFFNLSSIISVTSFETTKTVATTIRSTNIFSRGHGDVLCSVQCENMILLSVNYIYIYIYLYTYLIECKIRIMMCVLLDVF